ncbi:MAG: ferrous iron transport protein B, partial [Clostridia bacterium]|nr:ferrous iron transport protein B [Clostridia bacterium]
NWPGKTVTNASGRCSSAKNRYVLVDIPGTYSLMAHSAEEEVARNYLCFGEPDAVVVVCDATCLERNLNLALQTMEISKKTVVCVNLADEAEHKGIHIDIAQLARRLGVPVVSTVARQKKSLSLLLDTLDDTIASPAVSRRCVTYPVAVESAVACLEPLLKDIVNGRLNSRWVALKLLENDNRLLKEINGFLQTDLLENTALQQALIEARDILQEGGITENDFEDVVVSSLIHTAETICRDVVTYHKKKYNDTDRHIDRIVTGKRTAYPLMLLLLAVIFWLTIVGANYPSEWLSALFSKGQEYLSSFFVSIGTPAWLHDIIVHGAYQVLTWVVAVMLPPMAIFFPLFTLLEDVGYLPRVAYNLDRPFHRCHACGKQALTMSMGFGCNAVGVVGARIIDSPRERLLAILTNNFVPCNGRFPTLIAILTIFFISSTGIASTIASSLLLTLIIFLGILLTFATTKLLSVTLLKGIPSSFTLEMPPYRRPQIGQIIIRSLCDRTLFVLGRAVAVAAPAGILIWVLANVTVGNISLLTHISDCLDPFARLMGLDGIILTAFILGFPANEIVVPIMLMAYLSQGSLVEAENLVFMKQVLVDNGWTWHTAVSMLLFSLLHWPCSTTLWSIQKETGSIKWTAVAFFLPTVIGIAVCMLFTALVK